MEVGGIQIYPVLDNTVPMLIFSGMIMIVWLMGKCASF